MDNFEYSIQINDRDWDEFYSTAEECGLMQVSLAKEEEPWLSDTEQEDTTNCTLSKFIRISLCPPQEEHPNPHVSQPILYQSVPTSNRWLDSSEDVLSGSEDDEEFGSVARFLCQKEYMLQKKESEHRIDIPLPKPVDRDDITNPWRENSRINSVAKSTVEYMRTLNIDRNVKYNVDPQQDMDKTTMERSSSTQEELGHPGTGPSANLTYPNNSSYCAQKIESFSSLNSYNQDKNIPDVNISGDGIIGKTSHTKHETTLSGCLSKDNGIFDKTSLEEPPSSTHNGLVYYTMENDVLDNSSEVALEASVYPSAVEQNGPSSIVEEFHSSISQSDNLNIDGKAKSNPHHATSTHNLAPVNITTRTWRNPTPLTQPSSVDYRKTVLTIPEMYDFFFDDVSNTVSELSMASKEGIVNTPEMYEYFFVEDEEENRVKRKDGNTSQVLGTDLALAPTSPVVAAWPEACEFFFADGPQDHDGDGILFSLPPSQIQSAAAAVQTLDPEGLQGFTVWRAPHRRGQDGSLTPQDSHGTSKESNISGSIVPYLSASRSDACLVFLAFASWAVKSSDLQSSEGWKTALLANIGAVSAIQYLRRRRRTWQEPPPQTRDET